MSGRKNGKLPMTSMRHWMQSSISLWTPANQDTQTVLPGLGADIGCTAIRPIITSNLGLLSAAKPIVLSICYRVARAPSGGQTP